MHRISVPVLFTAALLATAAWADDQNRYSYDQETTQDTTVDNSQPETIDNGTYQDQYTVHKQQAGTTDTTQASTAEEGAYNSAIKQEGFGIKPQAGVMVFHSPLDNTNQARLTGGLTLDANVTKWVMGDEPTSLYIGPSTGALYSHLGSSNANFVGNNATGTGTNTNFLLIPANLKLGWNASDVTRISIHGGGNVVYRSTAGTIALGSAGAGSSGWDMFPNFGGDLEFGLGRSVAFLMRPDWTFTNTNNLFTGTIGLSAALG